MKSIHHKVTIDQFVTLLENVHRSGNGYKAACPHHGGKDANLAIWTRDDGTIGTKCYSHGCDRKDVIEATGHTLADILPARTHKEVKTHRKAVNKHKLIADTRIELLIILQHLDASYKKMFTDLTDDPERVRLAFDRAIHSLNYLRGDL